MSTAPSLSRLSLCAADGTTFQTIFLIFGGPAQ
jgi:hypothetical protein